MNEDFILEEELKKLPDRPGVYIMHGAKDEILYVGKAVVLKNRVRQYFQAGYHRSPKIERMVSQVTRFEYIVTDSEMEALVLECNLIKEHRPKYNTMLKDDKGYPYIRVTEETYPRIVFSHQMHKDHSRYFGPFTNAGAVKETLDLLHRLYPVRFCTKDLPAPLPPSRPCLNYYLHQCKAPCMGWITPEDYKTIIRQATDFLSGKYQDVIKDLTKRMEAASEEMDFEQAAGLRDLIVSVRHITEKQKITDTGSTKDRDVVGFYREDTDVVVTVFFIRDGRMIGRENFHVSSPEDEEDEVMLESFLTQYYAGTPLLPDELWLPIAVGDETLITGWLTERKGSKVSVKVPKIGSKEKFLELASSNAAMVWKRDKEKLVREEERTKGAVMSLSKLLSLPYCKRMESYDISHISGYSTVGSMVVYEDGRPKRSDYRKFKMKYVMGIDDYACMEEVLTRRFQRALDRDQGFMVLPDVLLMDGGKGQVHAALAVLDKLGLSIPVCGMVKDDHHRTRGLYYQDREVPIEVQSEVFHLLTRVQDEVHRFAIEYHRSLRNKEGTHSLLTEIPGIGETRRKALMRTYNGLEDIRKAGVTELAAIKGMDKRAAQAVYDFFHPITKEVPDEQ